MDPYKTLNIKRDASEEEIKRAYRKLAKECHPDANPGDKESERKFKEICEAYAILSDEERRNEYDKNQDKSAFNGNQFSDINFSSYEDIFNAYGNVFYGGKYDDVIKHLFKDYTESKTKIKGQDIEMSLEIDFLDAVNGCKKNITVKRNGDIKTLEITVPKGIDDGQKLKIKGMGEDGKSGGEKGNLIIEIKVKPNPYFTRKGNDIFIKEDIPFSTVVLGGPHRIMTITGNIILDIPKGIKPGTNIKIKGKGINGGDQYVEIQVCVPASINDKQKTLIKELQKLGL